MGSYKITITGFVQGVGFRPFVAKLANALAINGTIKNTLSGVEIECSGERIDEFIFFIRYFYPSSAKIESFEIAKLDNKNSYDGFIILKSSNSGSANLMMRADIALCDECESEMRDKTNRRYNYPFINCASCGPRYSIIKSLPYDRANTTMDRFAMCSECESEYSDLHSCRYHAEAISCHKCGPKLSLLDNRGEIIEADVIESAVSSIKNGEIVAIKGIGGFHLVCDATNDSVVQKLRLRKRRALKPLAVMFRDLEQLRESCNITDAEADMINSSIKPIVLVDKKERSILSSSIAPEVAKAGVFLPYSPLHQLILDALDFPIVATSANISGESIITTREEIVQKLSSVVDKIVDFDRDIINPVDDSVVEFVGAHMSILRNARGLAPLYISFKNDLSLMALGAHQKSTISLTTPTHLCLSPYIGDLESISTMKRYRDTIERYKNFYEILPNIYGCDLHSGYESSKIARDKNHIKIQHHYAHILSVMAENAMDKKVLGFAFDGTGAGDDGTLWGGEVFICDTHGYERVGYIKPFRLLGGEVAIKEPRRVALSLLLEAFSVDEIIKNSLASSFSEVEIRLFYEMYQKGLNSPLSSSMGRLFDGVASLLGVVNILDYEAQSGLMMQKYTDLEQKYEPYSFSVDNGVVDIVHMIREIVDESDIAIAYNRFMATILSICEYFVSKYSDFDIVASGGVFQNSHLLSLMIERFGDRLYLPKKISTNDESISLGQLYYMVKNR